MSDLRVTPAEAADTDAIAHVHRLSHTVSYLDFLDASQVHSAPLEDYRTRWRDALAALQPGDALYVARQGGAVVGFLHVESLTDRYPYYDLTVAAGMPPGTTGVVRQLHIHPDYRGYGIGQALMQAARDGMRHQGWTEAVLDTHAANDRARRFYEANGWTAFHTAEHPNFPVEMICYRCNL